MNLGCGSHRTSCLSLSRIHTYSASLSLIFLSSQPQRKKCSFCGCVFEDNSRAITHTQSLHNMHTITEKNKSYKRRKMAIATENIKFSRSGTSQTSRSATSRWRITSRRKRTRRRSFRTHRNDTKWFVSERLSVLLWSVS